MTDLLNASLILKTSDITQQSTYLYGNTFSSQVGSMNAKGSSITWNNINLRTVLGTIYDKYDVFNLCLNTISTAQANTIDVNPDSRNITIKMSGLPWINQTYNTKSNSNGTSTSIATFNFTALSSTTQYYYSNNIATFGKNSDTCNITIDYFRILDDVIPNSNINLTQITNLTGTGLINSNVLALSASNANVVLGSGITGAGIPANTYISYVSGTTIILSNILTIALNNTAITITPIATYPNTIFILDIFGIPKDEGNINGTRL